MFLAKVRFISCKFINTCISTYNLLSTNILFILVNCNIYIYNFHDNLLANKLCYCHWQTFEMARHFLNETNKLLCYASFLPCFEF